MNSKIADLFEFIMVLMLLTVIVYSLLGALKMLSR
jgi:hypothetical protein